MASAQPRLHRAAARGDEGKVKQFISAGDDVNARGAEGSTALLEAGADPTTSDNEKFFPLYVAAQYGNIVIAKALIRASADINAIWPGAGTPLLIAAHRGDQALVRLLLDAGADTSKTAATGHHPLAAASIQGHADVVTMLLDAGVDVGGVSSDGAHADVNREDDRQRTPLSSASTFADAKAVNLLLNAGADINQQDSKGRTPLFFTCDVKIVKVLLDRGADVKLLDKFGETVLHSAGYRGVCAGVICALFKSGVDPTVKDIDGETAADLARRQGHEDAAKLLDLLAAKHRAMNSA